MPKTVIDLMEIDHKAGKHWLKQYREDKLEARLEANRKKHAKRYRQQLKKKAKRA